MQDKELYQQILGLESPWRVAIKALPHIGRAGVSINPNVDVGKIQHDQPLAESAGRRSN